MTSTRSNCRTITTEPTAISIFGSPNLAAPSDGNDFRQYDLDAPFPVQALEFARNSFFTGAQRITNLAVERGLTLRQTIETITQNRKTSVCRQP